MQNCDTVQSLYFDINIVSVIKRVQMTETLCVHVTLPSVNYLAADVRSVWPAGPSAYH